MGNRSRGITWIDLAILLAIAAILATIAIPNIMFWNLRESMKAEVSEIQAELREKPYIGGVDTWPAWSCREGFRIGRGNRYFKCDVSSQFSPAGHAQIIRILHYTETGDDGRPFKPTGRLKWVEHEGYTFDFSYYEEYGTDGFPDEEHDRWDF